MRSEISAEFSADIKEVWDTVTNNNDYKWRSDIKKIDVLDHGDAFVEYDKNNIKTTCYVTKKVKYEVYEFNIENENLYGNFKGNFYETNDGKTKVVFVEDVYVKDVVKRIIAKAFNYLGKMQSNYINDLRNKLKEQ